MNIQDNQVTTDDNEDDDGVHLDLFRDLDVDLIDLFSRGNVALLFDGLPEEERNARLAELNVLLSSRFVGSFQAPRHRNRLKYAYRRYVYRKQLFLRIPIPMVRVGLLWREYSPSLLAYFTHMYRIFMWLTTYIMWISVSWFVILMLCRFVFNVLLLYISQTVLLNDLVSDVVTYFLSDSVHYHDIYKDAFKHGLNFFYFLDEFDDERDGNSSLQYFQKVYHYWVASFLNMNCQPNTRIKDYECIVDTNSLVFKFEDTVRTNLPSFGSFQVLATTLTIYFAYVIVSTYIAFHVFGRYTDFFLSRGGKHNKLYLAIFRNSKHLVRNVV